MQEWFLPNAHEYLNLSGLTNLIDKAAGTNHFGVLYLNCLISLTEHAAEALANH